MKSPLVKSLISLLQKCTLQGRSQRLVGKQPTLTVLIVLTNIFFLLSYIHCSPIGNGCNSTATKSRTQDSTQGTQLQNKWVIPIFLNPCQLLFTYITRLQQKFPSASLRKALSIQNLSQIEKPWENVTLNRCLFVAITILVLTSGFQRLHGK